MAQLPPESDELFVPIDAESTGSLADVGLSAPQFFPSPLESTHRRPGMRRRPARAGVAARRLSPRHLSLAGVGR